MAATKIIFFPTAFLPKQHFNSVDTVVSTQDIIRVDFYSERPEHRAG
jgi:hypothetical protein